MNLYLAKVAPVVPPITIPASVSVSLGALTTVIVPVEAIVIAGRPEIAGEVPVAVTELPSASVVVTAVSWNLTKSVKLDNPVLIFATSSTPTISPAGTSKSKLSNVRTPPLRKALITSWIRNYSKFYEQKKAIKHTPDESIDVSIRPADL